MQEKKELVLKRHIEDGYNELVLRDDGYFLKRRDGHMLSINEDLAAKARLLGAIDECRNS